MIESFWKKYWFDMVVGFGFLVGAIVFLCFWHVIPAIFYLVSGLSWVTLALVSYNRDRINALAKRVADLENELSKKE